jgi:hypothetical protein
MSKSYDIPIIYQKVEVFTVDAENLQEAADKALNKFLSIPDDDYICDSFQVDDVVEDWYNEPFDPNKILQ